MSLSAAAAPKAVPVSIKKQQRLEGKSRDNKKSLEKLTNLSEKLGLEAIACMQRITKDNSFRVGGCIKDGEPINVSLLKEGIFYPNEYFQLLKKIEEITKKPQPRLQHFIDKGNFYHGIVSKKHFEMHSNPQHPYGYTPVLYILKKDVAASDALEAIFKGLTFLTCSESCEVSFYSALLQILGKEKFNALFGSDTESPLSVGVLNALSPGYLLYEDHGPSEKMQIGDQIFIAGPKSYLKKHIQGEGGNWNLLCIDNTPGKERFIGFGLNPEGVTMEEILQMLLDEYNSDSIDDQIVTKDVQKKYESKKTKAELLEYERLKNHKMTLKEMLKDGGGKITVIRRLDKSKIEQLLNHSIEDGLKLISKWKKKYLANIHKVRSGAE